MRDDGHADVRITPIVSDALDGGSRVKDNGTARDFWYPVALIEELEGGPLACRLLDEDIVVFKHQRGISALRDLCCHRGTPLSMGSVKDDVIVCGYHGWEFDETGRCVRIPQRSPERAIPNQAKVDSYRACERFGAVWVCLGEPQFDLPAFPEFDDPEYRTIFTGTYTWQAGAARMMENFIDPAHFAFIHPGILGDPRRPEFDLSPIDHVGDGFTFSVTSDVPAADDGETWVSEPTHFRFRLPYQLRIVRERSAATGIDESVAYSHSRLPTVPEGDGSVPRLLYFICIQPISWNQSRRYTWMARNCRLDEPDANFLAFQDTLNGQDQAVVERQKPELLPLDLTAEMQVKGVDDPGLEFRRLLAKAGLIESSLTVVQSG